MIPIHVMIPSYNNVDGLQRLLPQLQQQPFASITVLDDASTDETVSVLACTFPEVLRVTSERNLGPVGANNLSLESMPETGWILFLDSDMELVSEDIPCTLNTFILAHPCMRLGVGKILGDSGERIRWNFNYDINPWRAVLAFLTYHPAVLLRYVPVLGPVFRNLSRLFTTHTAPDVPQKVDWGIESCFFVSCDWWKKLHGFDTRYKRFHEGPDLFLQTRVRGFETWYTPDIVVQNHDQASGTSWHRRWHWCRSVLIYFWKHPSRLLVYYFPRP